MTSVNFDTGFPPIAAPDARVLILGSMPSQASLSAGRYYAHPRNAFWPILSAFMGLPEQTDYRRRAQALMHHRLALWDVLAGCHRPGSLDANIDPRHQAVNDFAAFLSRHGQIRSILFNGATAEKIFLRQVRPTLADGYRYQRLPSTSPAHARLSPAEKQALWIKMLQWHGHQSEI